MPRRPSKSIDSEVVTVALPLVWIGVEETDITFVNSIAVQPQGDEIIVVIGQQAPPLLLGPPEEIAKQAKSLKAVPVRTAMRLGLTKQRLAEFADVLQRASTAVEEQTPGRRRGRKA